MERFVAVEKVGMRFRTKQGIFVALNDVNLRSEEHTSELQSH